ncbi:MAG: tripartite tricarboxylate transporter substrate binding protein, partial [Oxalobacteraceae bacterium]
MKRLFLQLLAMCSMVAPWATARADEAYPTHPLRWVLPYQAGSQPDIIARFLAQRLGTRLHQVVVVENRPGAGGLIGADIVAKAAPDGYTLGYLSTQHLAHKFLLKSVPYDAVKDFQPIQLVGSVPQVMVVAQANPAKTMADFTARAKASATPVTFGSGGLSSPAHLAGQALASAAGFQAQHVPYKGSPEALSALIGGQVDYAVE